MYSSKKTNSSNEAVTLPPSGERADSNIWSYEELNDLANNLMSAYISLGEEENDV